MVIARVVSALALLVVACGGGPNHWTPYSATQKFEPTVQSCVLFYEGDIERIKSVGGRYAGKITFHARRAETRVLGDAREEAAKHGGTHCVVLSAETWAPTRAAFLNAWPGMNEVVPVNQPSDVLTLLVVNVPETNWPKLPDELRPKRPSQEFQW